MSLGFKKKAQAPSPAVKPSDIYHDIYDFSYFPFSYGDTITWSMLSAIRCMKAGRKGVHVHLVCDINNSGGSLFNNANNPTEMFVLELLPAFTSCPLFSALTLHSSRFAFDEYWKNLSVTDDLAAVVYKEHLDIFHQKENHEHLLSYFGGKCSYHKEINEWVEKTGKPLHMRLMPECVADVEALKQSFAANTFWVSLHCRLLKLDQSILATRPGSILSRDGNFAQWYNFIERAGRELPNVRFVLMGRVQEKPLAMLRLPNVIMPRVLGMTVGHELAFIHRSDLFMGSPAGPAQAAFFSPIDYAVFRCTPLGCKHLDIPFGYPRVPFSTPMQRLFYGSETSELLMRVLVEHVRTCKREIGPVKFSTTSRFFISTEQEDRELSQIFRPHLQALIHKYDEAGEKGIEAVGIKKEIGHEMDILEESFSPRILQIPEYVLLRELLESEQLPAETEEQRAAIKARRELLWSRVGLKVDRKELTRGGILNHFPEFMPGCVGLQHDGLCSKYTKLQFGHSLAGSYLILEWLGTAMNHPVDVEIQVADEDPVRFSLPPGYLETQVFIARDHARTPVFFRFSSECEWTATDPRICSALLGSVKIVASQQSLKRDERGLFPALPGSSGIRADGWCQEQSVLSLGSSNAGDKLIIDWLGTAGAKPVELEIQIEGEKPILVTVSHDKLHNEILLTQDKDRTDVGLRFKSSRPLAPQDPYVASAQLGSARIECAS